MESYMRKLLNEASGIRGVDMDFLAKLDDILVKDGKLDEKVFEHLYEQYSETLAYENENRAGWGDLSLKDQVFGWLPDRGGIWDTKNDIPLALAKMAKRDKALQEEILAVAGGMTAEEYEESYVY